MNRNVIASLLVGSLILLSGCTQGSTRIAQMNSIKVQAVKDGVVSSLAVALARENYETAVLSMQIANLESGAPPSLADKNKEILKSFAQKRDKMTSILLDNERANTLKAVTVDAKLYSEQGILNYIGSQLSSDSKKFWTAWDVAKGSIAASQPSK